MIADCFVAGVLRVLCLRVLVVLGLGTLKGLQLGVLSILGVHSWFYILPSQSSLCSSSFLQKGQCGPHEHFSVACLGIAMAWGIQAT